MSDDRKTYIDANRKAAALFTTQSGTRDRQTGCESRPAIPLKLKQVESEIMRRNHDARNPARSVGIAEMLTWTNVAHQFRGVGERAGEAVESMFLSPQTRKPICDKWVNSKGADNWPHIAMLHTTI